MNYFVVGLQMVIGTRFYTCFSLFLSVLPFHWIWQLFNEYVRLILTLSKPDAQESNLSRAKLKSIPSLIRYVNTCKRMDATCLTPPRTFPVRISERLSAHLPSQKKSTSDINAPNITVETHWVYCILYNIKFWCCKCSCCGTRVL